MRARIDSASHGNSQVPLKASRVSPTIAARAAPSSRDMPRSTTSEGQPGQHSHLAGERNDPAVAPPVTCEVGLRQQAADRRRVRRGRPARPLSLTDPGDGISNDAAGRRPSHRTATRPRWAGSAHPASFDVVDQQLGQDQRLGIRSLPTQTGEVHQVQRHRHADGQQVRRVPSGTRGSPRTSARCPCAPAAGRHDVAADDEEDEDAVKVPRRNNDR